LDKNRSDEGVKMSKCGVLLINLGTPDNCDSSSVYRYLKQFLNDPRVIDLPKLIRFLLVNVLIVPFRYKRSARAYQQIWTPAGSPLLVNSHALVQALARQLGEDFHVELGMRYGNPSIASAVAKLSSCQRIVVIPLFPQYSSAASGSAMQEFLKHISMQWNIPEVHLSRDFFNHPGFILAYAALIQKHVANKVWDKIIFSYHGLPERHINKSQCRASCSRLQSCPPVDDLNAYCYRAQCYETSRLLAQQLQLEDAQYQVTFQSRLGRTPWIKPYTDLALIELRKNNIKNIAIVCPSFVADCLETVEEINLQAREQWRALGGENFIFIPCLNDDAIWVKELANQCQSVARYESSQFNASL
jgi:ferrochelatase